MTLIPTLTDLDTDKATEVMGQFNGDPWPYVIRRPVDDPSHLLITCEPPRSWACTMPGEATRQGIARYLQAYEEALRDAGFGTATWVHRGRPRVLIVTADQATADDLAPGIRAYLTERNPEPAGQRAA